VVEIWNESGLYTGAAGAAKSEEIPQRPAQNPFFAGGRQGMATGDRKRRAMNKAGGKPGPTTGTGKVPSKRKPKRAVAAVDPRQLAPDGRERCAWSYAGMSRDYILYHDTEWGVPVHDDRRLFEFLILEGAQAGLSWSTILRKREGYREAFAGFDPARVARFDARKVERLLQFDGIVRNRLKVESAILNARCFLAVQREFGSFAKYSWGFVGGRPIVNRWTDMKQVPARTAESDAFSKDLQRRGFKFVGSTIMYAHMQATGMVNDHVVGCFRHEEVNSE
jgi:DNA-3-methyladenine glycosylase I